MNAAAASKRKIADVRIGARFRLPRSGRIVKIGSILASGMWLATFEESGLEITVIFADLGEELESNLSWTEPEDVRPMGMPRRRRVAMPPGLDWRRLAAGEREDE